jgi:hypothetical protein
MLQRRLTGSTRRRRQVALGAALLGVQVAATGCSTPTDKCPALPPAADLEVYRSAERAQVEHLENEVARLREDLDQAEEAMVTVESGLRDVHIRADAVSSLAEARIAVERASKNVSWRPGAVREAQSKLEEAELQLQAGHPGSAVFFASRARRIAENLDAEARRVAAGRSLHGAPGDGGPDEVHARLPGARGRRVGAGPHGVRARRLGARLPADLSLTQSSSATETQSFPADFAR